MKRTMTTSLEQLNKIASQVDLNEFYVVSIYPYKIQLQGNFNSALISRLRSAGFFPVVWDDDYYHMENADRDIHIALT